MEIMSPKESLWEESHHRSLFLPNADFVDSYFVSLISFDMVKNPQTLVLLQGVGSKENLCNITKMISIYISMDPGVVEHVHIG